MPMNVSIIIPYFHFDNGSFNWTSSNGTELVNLDPVASEQNGVYVAAGMLTLGIIIILLNSWMIICLKTHRSLFSPRSLWYHFSSLSFNDFLTGISVCSLALYKLQDFGGKEIKVCKFILLFYIACQTASIFNIIGICILRLTFIQNIKYNKVYKNIQLSILTITSSWIMSISILLLGQHYVDAQLDHNMTQCTFIDSVHPNMAETAAGSFAGIMFTEVVIVNILYYICIFKVQNILQQRAYSAIIMQTIKRMERRVNAILGIILLLLNIVTLPSIITTFLFSAVTTVIIPQYIHGMVFLCLTLNSLVNPLLYTYKSKAFKVASNKNMSIIINTFKIKCNSSCKNYG